LSEVWLLNFLRLESFRVYSINDIRIENDQVEAGKSGMWTLGSTSKGRWSDTSDFPTVDHEKDTGFCRGHKHCGSASHIKYGLVWLVAPQIWKDGRAFSSKPYHIISPILAEQALKSQCQALAVRSKHAGRQI
jgi:hypothetical protein